MSAYVKEGDSRGEERDTENVSYWMTLYPYIK
jgi:hypothetical protein